MMKLQLPSDIQGGIAIFAIMFTITIVEIYVFKNVRAFKSESLEDRAKRGGRGLTGKCLAFGGQWMGNTEDPDCKGVREDQLLEWIPVYRSEDENTRLGCPDWCFTAKGNLKKLGSEQIRGCEKCPQPAGFGYKPSSTSGGFL
jgi:hypothetical protein